MTNFLLTSDKEQAQQNGSMHSCNYCNRVFNSHKALGGHLKAHKNIMWKYPYYRTPNNSIDGNHHENDTELILSSSLSYATNCNASSRALSLSGGSMPSALPLGPSMYMGYPSNPLGLAPYGCSTGFCHFKAEALRSFLNRFPYLSKYFLQTMKYRNHNNHPYSPSVICSLCPCHMMNNFSNFKDFIPHPGLDMNKFPGMKNPVFAGLLPPAQAQLAGSFCPNDNIRGVTSGRVKKRCFCKAGANAVKIRAPKRPRVSSSSHVRWERNLSPSELLLFKDAMNSFSASEIPTDGEEKDEADLDL